MTSLKDFWNRSTGGNIPQEATGPKSSINSCADTSQDCASGYVCVGGECVKSTAPTGSDWCPSEDYSDSCSGCGGNDPECSNGIITNDFDGNTICVPSGCNNSSPCPSGYTCQSGICKKSNCSSIKPCANGYFCVNGVCSPDPDDGSCDANIDCPYGFACVNGACEEVDVEPPDYPTYEKECSVFCEEYYDENNSIAPGCQDLLCGDCSDCYSLSVLSDSGTCGLSNSCECREKRGELPECVVCDSDGASQRDCGCQTCASVSNVVCPCGKVLPPQSFCKSVCADGLAAGSVLNSQIMQACNAACSSNDSLGECDGRCYTVTISDPGYSCPINYVCELVGQITVGSQTEYIYRNCDPTSRPAYCEGTPAARRHISLSVIDEDDSYDFASKVNDWASYRAASPDGIFVCLVPQKGNGTVSPPPGYDGSLQGVSLTADWAAILQGPLANASSCYAFIDNSGSMTVGDVAGSIAQFSSYCSANGIAFNYTTNATENWIGPHVGFRG